MITLKVRAAILKDACLLKVEGISLYDAVAVMIEGFDQRPTTSPYGVYEYVFGCNDLAGDKTILRISIV